MKYKTEEKDVQVTELHGIIDQHLKQINRLEQETKEAKNINDKLTKEVEQMMQKYEKLQLDYNSALYDVTRTKSLLQEKNQEHKVRQIFY